MTMNERLIMIGLILFSQLNRITLTKISPVE